MGAEGSTTGTDLQGMNGNLGGNYVLGANIDASTTSGWDSGAGFMPIGNQTTRFNGSFDGLGHAISALMINRPATNYVGLFGFADSTAKIRNVGLTDVDVTGASDVGGLVGATLSGAISNSYATGRVVGIDYAAGLVGVSTGSVSNSYATGQVVGSSNYTGGLMGANMGTITNSYATGVVTGGGNATGGLAGESKGNISNSYATGTASGGAVNVAGLVGIQYSGSISRSYATGGVSGPDPGSVGGLVGRQDGGTITDSYWDTQTTG